MRCRSTRPVSLNNIRSLIKLSLIGREYTRRVESNLYSTLIIFHRGNAGTGIARENHDRNATRDQRASFGARDRFHCSS